MAFTLGYFSNNSHAVLPPEQVRVYYSYTEFEVKIQISIIICRDQ